ncbi:CBS domain-containing protein [Gordonia sp. (in: high G+C Gram-positive bacteria)]|uniref:CBS domain-containing protein n=1 Tax=Gordonia sp. (in: high G+C Gram-positive bacteria) TaxID=84139 RepID=UPI00169389B0|nr:CBS domain-containing protein [Gordonia sp. (in: high G+C Gram-positive bacteria)]NLG46681.1 CBS domain-containing protein [Gordonia sp. (in: high G+C Gram-positive bacteria)]
MRISQILNKKGSGVITVPATSTVRGLLATLDEWNIGAVLVVGDGGAIAGIASERDVVRCLHTGGASILDGPVSGIMTAVVHTCTPDDPIEGLREIMTEHRVRHLPVMVDGELVGIVSIGDVVKNAIDQLEAEREHLVQYIQH